MKHRFKRLLFFFFLTAAAGFAGGCGEKEEEIPKIKDLEYTVVEEGEVPEELLEKIRELRATPFQMTYESEGYLYIAKGYGTQKTSGYSVRVLELYQAESGIVFASELLGPEREEPVLQMETWPYIVIKLPDLDLEIIF